MEGDKTIVAGVVKPAFVIDCPGELGLGAALESDEDAERYAAIKAAGFRLRSRSGACEACLDDEEAGGCALKRSPASLGLGRVPGPIVCSPWCSVPTAHAEHQMEAVFILSEIPTPTSGLPLHRSRRPLTCPSNCGGSGVELGKGLPHDPSSYSH